MQVLKPGDFVYIDGVYGTVLKIDEGSSIEDHGYVEILISKIDNKYHSTYLRPGVIEHFAHFSNIFQILNE